MDSLCVPGLSYTTSTMGYHFIEVLLDLLVRCVQEEPCQSFGTWCSSPSFDLVPYLYTSRVSVPLKCMCPPMFPPRCASLARVANDLDEDDR